jgi:hypothetical protein
LNPDLEDPYQTLHDTELVSATVEWKTGTAILQIGDGSRKVRLSAAGLRSLKMPRAHPWGPSRFINAVHGPAQLPDGLASLQIQMQSGDLIELIAQYFEISS